MANITEHGTTWWAIVADGGVPVSLRLDQIPDDSAPAAVKRSWRRCAGSVAFDDLGEDTQDDVTAVWEAHQESIEALDDSGYMHCIDTIEREPVSCVAASSGAAGTLYWTRSVRYPNGTGEQTFSKEPIDTVATVTASMVKLDAYAKTVAESTYDGIVTEATEWFGGTLPEDS